MRPKLSIVIPIHDMKGGSEFLWKSINLLMEQTFQDFEIVITKAGKMAENTNAGIKKARGELIKILYLDDVLAHENALKEIVEAFDLETEWLITGTDNNPLPYWTDDIVTGNNKLGSPSALTIRNTFIMAPPLMFDENLSWLLDCDYYHRMRKLWGEPKILLGEHINIGVGDHQVTHILTDDQKNLEYEYLREKHAEPF